MPYSSSSIEIDINDQIKEFQEREAFVEKQQSKICAETTNKEDKMKIDDYSTSVDTECLSPIQTRIIIDVA